MKLKRIQCVPGLLLWIAALMAMFTVEPCLALYNPSTGRWLTRDPIGEVGSALLMRGRQPTTEASLDDEIVERPVRQELSEMDLYVLVLNDPVRGVDPLGLLKFEGCTPAETNELSQQYSAYCEKVKQSQFKCCLGHFNIPQRLGGECGDPDVTIKCVHNYTKRCDPGTCSWSYPGSRTIRMCPDGLGKRALCNDPYGCQIMHEMTHMIGHLTEKWPQQVARCLDCTNWK